MIRADQIPDEVIISAREAWLRSDKTAHEDWREAIAAALSAWPDMAEQFFPNSPLRPPGIFLPLPQEARDE